MFNKKDWIFMAIFTAILLVGGNVLESYQLSMGWRAVAAVIYFAVFLIIERFVFASEEPELKEDKL